MSHFNKGEEIVTILENFENDEGHTLTPLAEA